MTPPFIQHTTYCWLCDSDVSVTWGTCYIRLRRDSVVRRTLIAMTDGDNPNRYPEGTIFMDCQGSELKDLETMSVNRTAWRHKVAELVFVTLHHWTRWVHYEHDDPKINKIGAPLYTWTSIR